jgi:hypothetical protein
VGVVVKMGFYNEGVIEEDGHIFYEGQCCLCGVEYEKYLNLFWYVLHGGKYDLKCSGKL